MIRIHPFYDGNGRVSRIVTNHYLLTMSKTFLNWADFDNKSKFIKKLNFAHDSGSIQYLYDYCKKFEQKFSIDL